MARARLRCLLALSGPGLLGAAPGSARLQTVVGAWVEGRAGHPSLEAVQEAAVSALGMEPEARVQGWSARARHRAWLPRLDVRLGTDRDLDVRRPGTIEEAWTEGQGLGADLALRWLLGGLVFDDAELRIEALRRARGRARRLAKERATRVFFERVEVELKRRGGQPDSDLDLEAARLDGLLDAITEGYWGTGP